MNTPEPNEETNGSETWAVIGPPGTEPRAVIGPLDNPPRVVIFIAPDVAALAALRAQIEALRHSLQAIGYGLAEGVSGGTLRGPHMLGVGPAGDLIVGDPYPYPYPMPPTSGFERLMHAVEQSGKQMDRLIEEHYATERTRSMKPYGEDTQRAFRHIARQPQRSGRYAPAPFKRGRAYTRRTR